MGPTAALVIQLAITALQRATELNQLLAQANAEGRDITAEELAAVKASAAKSVADLDAAIEAAKA